MKKGSAGISMIEILIVIGIFAVLGVLSTRVITLSLQGSKKGDAQIKVRENLDYAVSIIERQLRNAGSVFSCTVSPPAISYSDSNAISSSFSCLNMASAGYVASGSARLTSEEIKVTACSFVCTAGSGSTPPKVAINIQAEGVSISTEINLRTY